MSTIPTLLVGSYFEHLDPLSEIKDHTPPA
jgi:hypothetical protein